MKLTTYLFLDTTELTNASWIVVNEEGKSTELFIRQPLSKMSLSAKENELIVILPSQDILLTTVQLPKMSRSKLLTTLPFALEEQLITDVSELHFVPAEYEIDGRIPVAIISHFKMNEWISFLKLHALNPSQFLSTVLTLPLEKDKWHIVIRNHICNVRTRKFNGFTCEVNNLETLLHFALADTEAHPTQIDIFVIDNDVPSLPATLDNVQIKFHKLTETHFLQKITHWVNEFPRLNLLQDKYQISLPAANAKKTWKLTASMGVTCFLVALFGGLISFFFLKAKEASVDNQIKSIYMRNFPDATSLVAPRERLATKLNNLKNSNEKNKFLAMLAQAGKLLQSNPHLRIKNLEYKDSLLQIELAANNFDDIDELIKQLTQKGFNIKQQNAMSLGNQVKSTLSIK